MSPDDLMDDLCAGELTKQEEWDQGCIVCGRTLDDDGLCIDEHEPTAHQWYDDHARQHKITFGWPASNVTLSIPHMVLIHGPETLERWIRAQLATLKTRGLRIKGDSHE